MNAPNTVPATVPAEALRIIRDMERGFVGLEGAILTLNRLVDDQDGGAVWLAGEIRRLYEGLNAQHDALLNLIPENRSTEPQEGGAA